jgi:ribosome-associated translation inhibitor RaiA
VAPEGADVGPDGRIFISGHQTKVGVALRSHAEEKLERLSAKHFNGAEDTAAPFARGNKGARLFCNIRLHVGHDLLFDDQGDHLRNAYTVFASAPERVAKQLKRQKRGLREDKTVDAMNEALL